MMTINTNMTYEAWDNEMDKAEWLPTTDYIFNASTSYNKIYNDDDEIVGMKYYHGREPFLMFLFN